MKEICSKCTHYKTCKSPCYPVQQYLAQDNLTVFEKSHTNEDGKTVTITFARSREVPESSLIQRKDPGFEPEEVQKIFSTENNTSPFSHFEPNLKQTGIFVDRFFHAWTYEDLAVKYSVSVDTARKIYHRALGRIHAVLALMDQGEKYKTKRRYAERVAKRSGMLQKGQRWFLLNKLFQIPPSEIAKMEGVKKGSSSVRQLIIRVSDQLKAGEINLIDFSPQEATEAKERLEVHRAKRRDHHNRNKDQINAERRKQHTRKNS